MLFARVAAVAVGFPLVAFLPGWALLGRVRGLDAAERFTAAWGAGYALLAAAAFLAFLTHAPQPGFNLACLALLLGTAALLRRHPAGGTAPPDWWPVVGWALTYAHLLAVQALLPNYVGGDWWGDWCWHYREAEVFVSHLPLDTRWAGAGTYTLASRTPLFNLAAAFPLGVAGDEFWVFQVADAALNSCFVPALYLVVRDLFGPRPARLAVLLAPLNLWLLHNAWFTWPKLLTAYFLVLGLHFYQRWLREPGAGRWFLGCWVAGTLGFLTHQVAAVYLGALVLHTAVRVVLRRAAWPRLRDVALLAAVALLLVAPWYAWLAGQFGTGNVLRSTPVTQMDEGALTPLRYMGAVAFNLYASVVPLDLIEAVRSRPLSLEAVYRGLTDLYFSLLPGALTLSLCGFLAGTSVRPAAGQARAPRGAAWCFVLFGGLAAAALHPRSYQHGIAHAALFPSAVVLLGLAWGHLGRGRGGWAAVACAGMVLEFAAMFWSHVYLTDWPQLLDPYDPSINRGLKAEYQLRFLADCFEGIRPLVIAVAALIEGALIALLIHWFLPPDRGPERLQNGGGAV